MGDRVIPRSGLFRSNQRLFALFDLVLGCPRPFRFHHLLDLKKMQSSKLPIEVCEHVIDHLPIDNLVLHFRIDAFRKSQQALYACMLVCRDWVPRSRHHLFRNVILCDTRQAHAFLDTLTHHLHRAKLVQSLSIWPRTPSSSRSLSARHSPLLGPPGSPTPSSRLFRKFSSGPPISVIPPVLSSFLRSPKLPFPVPEGIPPQIKQELRSTLEGGSPNSEVPMREQPQVKAEETPTPPCYYNWIYQVLTRLPSLLVNLSNLSLCQLPTLHPRFVHLVSCFKTVKTLRLWRLSDQSFREVIQVVNGLPQLRCLHVVECRWEQPGHFFPKRRLRLAELNCVTFNGTEKDMLDWLGSLQDLSRLSALQFTIPYGSDMAKLYHILQQCTHSLRYFYLSLVGTDDDPYGEPCIFYISYLILTTLFVEFLSLSNHSNLEYFGLLIPSSRFLNHLGAFSSRVSQLIPSSIVYLTITFLGTLDLGSLAALPSSWGDLDNALSDPKFNQLTYFVVALDSRLHWNHDRTLLQRTFQRVLPKCYRRRILWIGLMRGNKHTGEHFSTLHANFVCLGVMWGSNSCLRRRRERVQPRRGSEFFLPRIIALLHSTGIRSLESISLRYPASMPLQAASVSSCRALFAHAISYVGQGQLLHDGFERRLASFFYSGASNPHHTSRQ